MSQNELEWGRIEGFFGNVQLLDVRAFNFWTVEELCNFYLFYNQLFMICGIAFAFIILLSHNHIL